MLLFEDDPAGGSAAVVGGGDAFLTTPSSCAPRSGRNGTGSGTVAVLCSIHLRQLCYHGLSDTCSNGELPSQVDQADAGRKLQLRD